MPARDCVVWKRFYFPIMSVIKGVFIAEKAISSGRKIRYVWKRKK
jgi:hypothetical protein